MGVGPVSNSSWAFKHRDIDVEKNKMAIPKNVNNAPAEKQVSPLSSSEDERGVIRLLQEGHFKGVADIRLRINFHEKLTGMENAAQADLVDAKVTTFEGAISEKINEILLSFSETDSEGVEDGATDTAPVTEALEAFANTRGTFFPGDLLEDLAARFDNLVASINGLIVPPTEAPEVDEPPAVELPENIAVPADEEGAEPPVASESEEDSPLEPMAIEEETAGETASIWATLVQELETSYENFRTELDGKTASYQILPDLSQPTGQGKAYDKFLAIYRALTGESQNTDVQTENLELLV